MDVNLIPSIRQRLIQPLPGKKAQLKMAPSFRPDININKAVTKAGVLLLLYPNPVQLYIVFMKRATYPGIHSAQVSFPGGKVDSVDRTIIDTALRETYEEIGIDPAGIEVLGSLTPLYIPVSEMEVYPAVGFCHRKLIFNIDPNEVEYLIEEPFRNFFNPNIIKTKHFSSEKQTGNIPYFDVQEDHIWGATAMILNEFIEIVNEIITVI